MRSRLRSVLAGALIVAGSTAFLTFGVVGIARAAGTCTDSWTAGAGGGWGAPGNWSTGAVPTSTDDVCIGDLTAGTYAVALHGSVSVHSVTVGGRLGGTQTLTVQGDSKSDGVLNLGSASSTIRQNGAMVLSSTNGSSSAAVVGSAQLTNQGSFSTEQGGGGTRRIGLPLANSGTVTISASDTLQDAPTLTTNGATFTVVAGAALALSGGASFAEAGGTLSIEGSFTQNGGVFAETGGDQTGTHPAVLMGVTMTDSAGGGSFVLQHQSSLAGTIPAGQTVTVLGGAAGDDSTVNLLGGTLTNQGTLVLDSGAGASTGLENGTLDNKATLRSVQGAGGARSLGVKILNEAGATVDIGSSDTRQDTATLTTNAGTLELEGGAHLTLSNGAELTESSGASTWLAVDAVNGSSTITGGTIRIDGILRVPTKGSPTIGSSYPLISGATRTGTFGSVRSEGAAYSITYSPSAVVLTVATPPALAVSPGGPQLYGITLSLTARVVQADAGGTVQFVADGSTNLGAPVPVSAGTATSTVNNLAVGAHQLTAVFTPADAIQLATAGSAQVPYTIERRPGGDTQTGLAVDAGSGVAGTPVTFTATVSPGAAPGTVSFSESPTGTVLGTTGPGSGTFVLQNASPGPGRYAVVATFNPSDPNIYTSSASPPVTFGPGAQGLGARGFSPDAQPTSAASPTGSLAITTPYTPQSPLDLGTFVLDSSGTMFSATATFQNIAISDSRAGALGITATAQSSDMTSGSHTIDSQDLGLTNLVGSFTAGNGVQAGQVRMFDNPAANPAVAPNASGARGLGGGVAHIIATVSGGPGSFSMSGTLTVNAPSSTPAAVYTGTITFTVG